MIDLCAFEFRFATVLHQFGIGTRIANDWKDMSHHCYRLNEVPHFRMPIGYFSVECHAEAHCRSSTVAFDFSRLNYPRIGQDYCSVPHTRSPLEQPISIVEQKNASLKNLLPSKLESWSIFSPSSHVSSNACRTFRLVSPSNSAVSMKQSPFGSLDEIRTISA